jgi:hypothetical protein
MSRTRGIGSRRLLAGAAAACVMAALAATVPAGSAAMAAGNDCAVLSDLTSVQVTDVTDGGPGIGESATFTDKILNAQGQVIGTRQGWAYIAYADPSTGDLIALYSAVFNLSSGIIESSGRIDTADTLTGKATVIHGTGLTGAYAGLTGTVSNQKVTDTTDTVAIDICRPGHRP